VNFHEITVQHGIAYTVVSATSYAGREWQNFRY